ncbi:hypothetical protein [Burkholderia anthina]|uniref:hypothetical protein n=1 Tax=Burkholderia anthina TaxID=179879 RepID=UPI001589F132|nr:hypothetical protein [Burkholderia anthina]
MSVIRWPEPFNEKGSLAEGEAVRLKSKSAPNCRQVLRDYSLLVGQQVEYLR